MSEFETYDEIIDGDYPPEYLAYPDDEKWIAELLRSEWSLTSPSEQDRHPKIYYDTVQNSTRGNTPIGSILVYDNTFNSAQQMGIGYTHIRANRSISIDVQNPKVRDRHYAWVREIIRILRKYRKAGRIKLHGWDAIEVTTVGKRNNYVGYYQSVIEVKLVREIVPLSGNGLGD